MTFDINVLMNICVFAGHDCKEDSVRSNTSDVENNESYSNGTQNLCDAGDSNPSEQRNLRHSSRNIKSGNGNGAGDNSSNESSDDDDEEDDDMLTTSSDDNEVYSKNSKNNNGTDIKRINQKRTSTLKTSIEHSSSSKKTRRSSALSIDLSLTDTTADAH